MSEDETRIVETAYDDPPMRELGPITFVHDRARNVQILQIKGVVVLPIGAEVELTNPNVNAVVTGVRLLAGNDRLPVHVCLDVDVPATYYVEER